MGEESICFVFSGLLSRFSFKVFFNSSPNGQGLGPDIPVELLLFVCTVGGWIISVADFDIPKFWSYLFWLKELYSADTYT